MNIYPIKSDEYCHNTTTKVMIKCLVCKFKSSKLYDNHGIDDNIVDDIKNFPRYDYHGN